MFCETQAQREDRQVRVEKTLRKTLQQISYHSKQKVTLEEFEACCILRVTIATTKIRDNQDTIISTLPTKEKTCPFLDINSIA